MNFLRASVGMMLGLRSSLVSGCPGGSRVETKCGEMENGIGDKRPGIGIGNTDHLVGTEPEPWPLRGLCCGSRRRGSRFDRGR